MKDIATSILLLVVGFLVSLALNSTVNIITQNRGAITFGPPVSGGGQLYMPVDITNFRDEIIDGLVLSIPVSTTITNTLSSGPIQLVVIEDAVGTDNSKRIRASGIEPKQITRLQFPIVSHSEAALVQAVNADDLNLGVTSTDNLKNPLLAALENALGYALITGVFYGVVTFWLTSHGESERKKIQERFDKLHEDTLREIDGLQKDVAERKQVQAEFQTQLDRAEAEIKRNQPQAARVKLLLYARLSDYTKELDFWRDTIRKILYQSIHNEQVGEVVIKQVTNNLKTYSTLQGGPPVFDMVKMLEVYMTSSNTEAPNQETQDE